MDNDVLDSDLRRAITKAEEIKTLIDRFYYSGDLGTIFNKPFISTLSTGADFLIKNLRILRQRYAAQLEKKG